MNTKPLVAIVFDEDGNPAVRVSGDVTVVWVDERRPHDRVFETTHQEDMDELRAFVGDPNTWGRSGDARQKRLEIQMANRTGPALKLVPPSDAI